MSMSRKLPPKRSAGFSMITAVVIVLMVSIVGFTAMAVSRSQLSAAGNAQYQITALHEADRSVATAETWLLDIANATHAGFTDYNAGASPALYPNGYMAANNLNPLTWTWSNSNSVAVGSASRYAVEQVAVKVMPLGESQRELVDIEGLTDCKAVNLYRISARGTSGAGATRTVQSIYGRQSCS